MDILSEWDCLFHIAQIGHTYLYTYSYEIYVYIYLYTYSLLEADSLSSMQETRVWFLGQEDALEKEMATNSSILAWRIPWVEEPGRLHQFMGSHRVGHDWATKPPPPAMKYILIWVWSIDLNVHIYFPSSVFPTPHARPCQTCHSITISAYVFYS